MQFQPKPRLKSAIGHALVFTLVLGSGCAAPAPSNPPDKRFAQYEACTKLKTGSLDAGASCRAIVDASNPVNEVGIYVRQGERYLFSVAKNHTWNDAWFRHPTCGSDGDWYMNLFAPLKRASQLKWLTLLAEIPGHEEQIDVCNHQIVEMTHAGQLILYANDVPLFYWNNSGKIEVLITHNHQIGRTHF